MVVRWPFFASSDTSSASEERSSSGGEKSGGGWWKGMRAAFEAGAQHAASASAAGQERRKDLWKAIETRVVEATGWEDPEKAPFFQVELRSDGTRCPTWAPVEAHVELVRLPAEAAPPPPKASSSDSWHHRRRGGTFFEENDEGDEDSEAEEERGGGGVVPGTASLAFGVNRAIWNAACRAKRWWATAGGAYSSTTSPASCELDILATAVPFAPEFPPMDARSVTAASSPPGSPPIRAILPASAGSAGSSSSPKLGNGWKEKEEEEEEEDTFEIVSKMEVWRAKRAHDMRLARRASRRKRRLSLSSWSLSAQSWKDWWRGEQAAALNGADVRPPPISAFVAASSSSETGSGGCAGARRKEEERVWLRLRLAGLIELSPSADGTDVSLGTVRNWRPRGTVQTLEATLVPLACWIRRGKDNLPLLSSAADGASGWEEEVRRRDPHHHQNQNQQQHQRRSSPSPKSPRPPLHPSTPRTPPFKGRKPKFDQLSSSPSPFGRAAAASAAGQEAASVPVLHGPGLPVDLEMTTVTTARSRAKAAEEEARRAREKRPAFKPDDPSDPIVIYRAEIDVDLCGSLHLRFSGAAAQIDGATPPWRVRCPCHLFCEGFVE